jgi:hypothetical protein
LARVPHSCAFCAQEWDSTEASYMGFGLHRGGWPIFAPAQTRLPHPSWFSKGENLEGWHQEAFLTPCPAYCPLAPARAFETNQHEMIPTSDPFEHLYKHVAILRHAQQWARLLTTGGIKYWYPAPW